jgi:DNA polymerase III epsilon subunit-like protein
VVFDTETTGLTDNKMPADHPSQPRLAHLAMVFVDRDLNIEKTQDIYVRPNGWEMSPEMLGINGLTTELLLQVGQPIDVVLDAYEAAIKAGRVMVAYGAQFDLKIMRGELRRAGRPDLFEETPNVCLMRAFKAYRKIYKGYKLSDACTYFGIPYERGHEAPADALMCLEVFRHLRPLGATPDPKVYYSKHYAEIQAAGAMTQDPGDRHIYGSQDPAPPGPSFRVEE